MTKDKSRLVGWHDNVDEGLRDMKLGDPVIGALYVRKVAELLSKIMEGRKVANRWRMHEIVSRNVLEREE